MRGARTTWWAMGAVVSVVVGGACSSDDGSGDGGGGVVATLPPIATTSTVAPSTTQNLLDQDRFVTVEQGDILSEISQRYEVSQDDLMEMNGISDPDAVYVGQVLELPKDAVFPTDVPTSLVTTTAAP